MAGFYFIRKFFPTYSPVNTGPELPGLPYPPPGGASDPRDIREIPLLFQDRVFQNNSQLWYPQADMPANMTYPQGTLPPIWIPEFLFDAQFHNPMMMVVNGRTWPKKVSRHWVRGSKELCCRRADVASRTYACVSARHQGHHGSMPCRTCMIANFCDQWALAQVRELTVFTRVPLVGLPTCILAVVDS